MNDTERIWGIIEPKVKKHVRRKVFNPDDAQDVCQEIAISFWTRQAGEGRTDAKALCYCIRGYKSLFGEALQKMGFTGKKLIREEGDTRILKQDLVFLSLDELRENGFDTFEPAVNDSEGIKTIQAMADDQVFVGFIERRAMRLLLEGHVETIDEAAAEVGMSPQLLSARLKKAGRRWQDGQKLMFLPGMIGAIKTAQESAEDLASFFIRSYNRQPGRQNSDQQLPLF
jgi:hypothetical protein